MRLREDNNITDTNIQDLTFADKFALCQLLLVFLVGTVGNSIVIYMFAWKKRKSRSRFEALLLPLAVTDFFASLIIPLLFTYGTLTHYMRWDFGPLGCKIISSLFPISITISQSILVLISFERYRAVTIPFGKHLEKSIITTWVVITIITALLLVSPYTISLNVITDDRFNVNTCLPNKFVFNYFYSLGNIARDIGATFAMIFLGVLTSRVIVKNINRMKGTINITSRLKSAIKARKMLVVVVCCFSICVFPLDIFQATIYTLYYTADSSVQGKESYSYILQVNTFLSALQVANSATNIIIYSKMHQDFKRNMCVILKRTNTAFQSSLVRYMVKSKVSFLRENSEELLQIIPPR